MANLSRTSGPTNIRAAAILTNAAVATTTQPVMISPNQQIMLYITFTVGSLTNVLVQPQVSIDGTNWFNLADPGLQTITATGKYAVPCNCAGAKLFRATATGTGTLTSSSLQLDVGFTSQSVTN